MARICAIRAHESGGERERGGVEMIVMKDGMELIRI